MVKYLFNKYTFFQRSIIPSFRGGPGRHRWSLKLREAFGVSKQLQSFTSRSKCPSFVLSVVIILFERLEPQRTQRTQRESLNDRAPARARARIFCQRVFRARAGARARVI